MLNRLNRLNFMSTLLFTMFSRPFSLKYESTSRNFQPAEGLLRDREILGEPLFPALLSTFYSYTETSGQL